MEDWRIASDYVFDRSRLNFFKKWWMDIDRINFILIVAVIIFGLIMSATSSPYIAKKINASDLFFIKKQIVFSAIAIFILIFISLLNEDQIKALSILGTAMAIILLVAVLIFGSETKGAKRWINIHGFALQPSEFVKPLFLVFNAFLLERFSKREWLIKYGVSAVFYAIIALLLILQPDFGMTFVITILWMAQLFVYGLPMMLVGFFGLLGAAGASYAYFALPHVAGRINKFLDIDNKNYQVERAVDAYVNGGLFGTGPGEGLVKRYIPDAHTDFIFAVVAEEFGVISCIAIMIIFFAIIRRVIKKLVAEDEVFSYLAVTGLILQFTLQVLINIGVSAGALPTKGMTLPFISYGGSSIMAMSLCFGMILALTKKKYEDQVSHRNLILG